MTRPGRAFPRTRAVTTIILAASLLPLSAYAAPSEPDDLQARLIAVMGNNRTWKLAFFSKLSAGMGCAAVKKVFPTLEKCDPKREFDTVDAKIKGGDLVTSVSFKFESGKLQSGLLCLKNRPAPPIMKAALLDVMQAKYGPLPESDRAREYMSWQVGQTLAIGLADAGMALDKDHWEVQSSLPPVEPGEGVPDLSPEELAAHLSELLGPKGKDVEFARALKLDLSVEAVRAILPSIEIPEGKELHTVRAPLHAHSLVAAVVLEFTDNKLKMIIVQMHRFLDRAAFSKSFLALALAKWGKVEKPNEDTIVWDYVGRFDAVSREYTDGAWMLHLSLGEGEAKMARLNGEVGGGSGGGEDEGSTVTTHPTATVRRPRSPPRSLLIPSLVGLVAAGAIGGGAALYFPAHTDYQTLLGQCAPMCNPNQARGIDTREGAGIALFAAGGAAAVADVVLWVILRRSTGKGVAVVPTVSSGNTGAAVIGAF